MQYFWTWKFALWWCTGEKRYLYCFIFFSILWSKTKKNNQKGQIRVRIYNIHLFWVMQSQVVVLKTRVWASPYWTNQSPNSVSCWNWLIIWSTEEKSILLMTLIGSATLKLIIKGAWLCRKRCRPPAAIGAKTKNTGLLFVLQNIRWHFNLNIKNVFRLKWSELTYLAAEH